MPFCQTLVPVPTAADARTCADGTCSHKAHWQPQGLGRAARQVHTRHGSSGNWQWQASDSCGDWGAGGNAHSARPPQATADLRHDDEHWRSVPAVRAEHAGMRSVGQFACGSCRASATDSTVPWSGVSSKSVEVMYAAVDDWRSVEGDMRQIGTQFGGRQSGKAGETSVDSNPAASTAVHACVQRCSHAASSWRQQQQITRLLCMQRSPKLHSRRVMTAKGVVCTTFLGCNFAISSTQRVLCSTLRSFL